MLVGRHRYVVEWGHLLVATLVAAVCIAYLLDARATSLSVHNLLLVQPAAILAALLYILIVPQCVHRVFAENKGLPEERAQAVRAQRGELVKVAALAVAFGFFVFSLETIGFDIATVLFVAAGLFIGGERRIAWLVFYPLIFTLAVIKGYQHLVPYPIVTRVL